MTDSFIQIGQTSLPAAAPTKLQLVLGSLVDTLRSAIVKQPKGKVELPNMAGGGEELAARTPKTMAGGAQAVSAMVPKMIGPQTLIPYQTDGLLISMLSPRTEATSGEYQRETQTPLITFEFEKLTKSAAHEQYRLYADSLAAADDLVSKQLAEATAEALRAQKAHDRLLRLTSKLIGGDHVLSSMLKEYIAEKLPAILTPGEWAKTAKDVGVAASETAAVGDYFSDVYNEADPVARLFQFAKDQMKIPD